MTNLKQLIKEFRESFDHDELPEFEAKCGSDLPKLLDAVELLENALHDIHLKAATIPDKNTIDEICEICVQALQLAEEKVRG